jgi:hypothetical protein
MSNQHQYDHELRDLWSRRQYLDQAEMTRLCLIVTEVLRAYRPRELGGLPEDVNDYINGFLVRKVLDRDLASQCDHVGALCYYYRNFLIDCLKKQKNRSKIEQHFPDAPEGDAPYSTQAADLTTDGASDSIEDLRQAGLQPQQVRESAAAWLAGSEEWVRIFVGLHNCPDADASEPLVHLARRKGIPSYAYRAKQLGFNWKGESPEGFADTLIGQWIVSLGIEIVPDNIPLVHGALKILCLEALLWAEQQETAP